jgi:hypothetical protein
MRKGCPHGAVTERTRLPGKPLGSHNVFHSRGPIRRDNIITQYTLWLPVAGREVNWHGLES